MKKAKGLALVEMIVALALSVGLLAGIAQLFVSDKKNAQSDTSINDMRDTGKAALDQLANTLRYRGFRGCAGNYQENPLEDYPIFSHNFIIKDLWKESLLGYRRENDGEFSTLPAANIVDGSTITTTVSSLMPAPVKNSDILVIYHASPAFTEIRQDLLQGSADALEVNTTAGFNRITTWQAGDIASISDCSTSKLFTITSATPQPNAQNPSSFLLGHSQMDAANMQSNDKDYFDTAFFAANNGPNIQAQVRQAWLDIFYVGNTQRTTAAGDPIFALYRSRNGKPSVEITEGIEFLGVQYGEVYSNGNIAYRTADDPNLTDFRSVQSVRVGLLATSTTPILTQAEANAQAAANNNTGTNYVLPGLTVTPNMYTPHGSRYLRQTFTTTVALKNRVDLMTLP